MSWKFQTSSLSCLEHSVRMRTCPSLNPPTQRWSWPAYLSSSARRSTYGGPAGYLFWHGFALTGRCAVWIGTTLSFLFRACNPCFLHFIWQILFRPSRFTSTTFLFHLHRDACQHMLSIIDWTDIHCQFCADDDELPCRFSVLVRWNWFTLDTASKTGPQPCKISWPSFDRIPWLLLGGTVFFVVGLVFMAIKYFGKWSARRCEHFVIQCWLVWNFSLS